MPSRGEQRQHAANDRPSGLEFSPELSLAEEKRASRRRLQEGHGVHGRRRHRLQPWPEIGFYPALESLWSTANPSAHLRTYPRCTSTHQPPRQPKLASPSPQQDGMPRRSPLLRPGQSLSTHADSRSERQVPRPAALRSAANTTASPSRNDAQAPGPSPLQHHIRAASSSTTSSPRAATDSRTRRAPAEPALLAVAASPSPRRHAP